MWEEITLHWLLQTSVICRLWSHTEVNKYNILYSGDVTSHNIRFNYVSKKQFALPKLHWLCVCFKFWFEMTWFYFFFFMHDTGQPHYLHLGVQRTLFIIQSTNRLNSKKYRPTFFSRNLFHSDLIGIKYMWQLSEFVIYLFYLMLFTFSFSNYWYWLFGNLRTICTVGIYSTLVNRRSSYRTSPKTHIPLTADTRNRDSDNSPISQ